MTTSEGPLAPRIRELRALVRDLEETEIYVRRRLEELDREAAAATE